MRLIVTLFIISLITSCSRDVYYAADGFFFSAKGITKSQLLLIIDEFSQKESFEKLSEGGERMLPEVKINFMWAYYRNKHGYEFLVQNVLNKDCFTLATYDKEKKGEEFAKELANKLKQLLLLEYKDTFIQYEDKYCKVAY